MSKRSRAFPYIILFIYLFFNVFFVFSQETYNECYKALDLCPNLTINANNINANKTLCTDCEDDFSSKLCFTSNNTIWFKFYTNDIGGDVTIEISSINYIIKSGKSQNLQASILTAKVPCDASTYQLIGNCISNGTNAISLNATNLNPNETFYLVINGAQNFGDNSPAEASFNLNISGPGVNRPIPTISLEKPKSKYCKDDVITFSCTTTDCKDSSSYQWFLNDSLISISNVNTLSLSKLNTGDKIRVSNSCFKTCSFEVEDSILLPVVIRFPVDAGRDTTIYQNSPLTLSGFTTADTLFWEPSLFLTDSLIKNPICKAPSSIFYKLTGIKNGCMISDVVSIHILKRLNTPTNSFSPNGDNINDTWEIPFLNDFPNSHVQIYTRWGQTVFETTGYSFAKSWDGKYNGSLVDPGTYYFVIELRDQEITEPIKGSLTVIR